jgi:predicted HTH domain antitoxin
MAAMMGLMLSNSAQERRIQDEIRYAYEVLKETGGVLNLTKASEFLGMSQDELMERLSDRSIFSIFIHLDLYIPLFQFEGKNHIPDFHDLWDALSENCSSWEICQFFVKEKLNADGECIRNLLCSRPNARVMKEITVKAKEFRKAEWI